MSNLVVQTNVLALNSHRNLKVVGGKQFTASARLSSGYRINSAADDAAGLAISEKMRAQIRGLDMASKNTQDGISLVQTAEGGMQEIDNMIQRIRELVVQAANDTNDFKTDDRRKIQDEIDQLTQGIDKMADQVEFNAKKLLDGSLVDSDTKSKMLAGVDKTIMTNTGNTDGTIAAAQSAWVAGFAALTMATNAMNSIASAVATINAGQSNQYTISVASAVSQAIYADANVSDFDVLDTYLANVDTYIASMQVRVDLGVAGADALLASAKQAKQNATDAAVLYLQTQAALTSKAAINRLSGDSLWFQTGANSAQGIPLGIGSIKTDILGIGDGNGGSYIYTNQAKGFRISPYIEVVENALKYVTAERAKLGAVQNRLEFTKSSLDISSENLSAAESRIRDADMAKEMMRLTAANILQQAGVSMLAQANQSPQSVLQLLR